MKNPFKTLAKRLVTAESNRIFRKAIMLAEKRHNEEGKRIYVIEHPENPKKLLLINDKEFLELRHRYGITSKQQPIRMLKSQCWYYTSNGSGKDPIDPRSLTVRKLAFIRDRLISAKLIE